MKKSSMPILISLLVIVALLILFTPFLTGFIINLSCGIFGKPKGELGSWIGYYGNVFGSFLGGIIGGLIAYSIARKEIEIQNKNNENDRIERIKYEIEIKIMDKILPPVHNIIKNLTQNYIFLSIIIKEVCEPYIFAFEEISDENFEIFLNRYNTNLKLWENSMDEIRENQREYINLNLGYQIVLSKYEKDFLKLNAIMNELILSYAYIRQNLLQIKQDMKQRKNIIKTFNELKEHINMKYLPYTIEQSKTLQCFNDDIQNEFLSDLLKRKITSGNYSCDIFQKL